MKTIQLTTGETTFVDDEDHAYLVSLGNWYGSRNAKSKVYPVLSVSVHPQPKLHRLLAEAGAGQDVDHINGDTLDNRKQNLRVCSHAENQTNMAMHKDNKLGVKGVNFNHRSGRYWSEVSCRGVRHRKSFMTLAEAEADAIAARERMHGQFARHK